MNHLLSLERLANRYFALRHGHSLANREGIIVSHPGNGCSGYGLSDEGRNQVTTTLGRQTGLGSQTLIISSDFNRALETASIARRLLGAEPEIAIERRLRERFFGELELGPDSAYDAVWAEDRRDADCELRSVESANRVMARVTELVADLESRHRDRDLLLVSHGDALQILQTAFQREDASRHRQQPPLQTAEIRQLLMPA